MTQRARRPVSPTIASGFSANRQAVGPEFGVVCDKLVPVARRYPGISLHFPSPVSLGVNRKPESRVVKNNQIRARADRLGHLGRISVYETIENLSSVTENIYATAELKELDYDDERTQRDNRVIAVTFDQAADSQLRDDNLAIGHALADLAGRPFDTLEWPEHDPDLVLAYVAQDAPAIAHATIRDVLDEHGPFLVKLCGVRLLPRLDPKRM
jgi:hypothetical protein